VTSVEPAPEPGAGTVREALAAAARVGPFFRLEAVGEASDASWLPVADLPSGALARLAGHTAEQLGTAEPRVAASITHLGLAARLWSPVLGCGLLRGVVPDLRSLAVASAPPARLRLSPQGRSAADSPGELAALSAGAVGPPLARLAAGLPVALPAGLLRGNSASAMAGALRVLVDYDSRLTAPAAELARMLLRTDALRGAGTFADAGGLSFRRRSCCLYYRVPGGGLCGDCCFTAPPRSGH
jgi:FhuF-like iron-sulfur protein